MMSSLSSLFVGKIVGIDYSDGAGMNLLNITNKQGYIVRGLKNSLSKFLVFSTNAGGKMEIVFFCR